MNDATSPTDDVYAMDELEKDLTKGRGGRRFPWFLAGLLIGIAGTLLLPPLLRPYLPDSLRGSRELAIGPVLAEQREGDRLLLTVRAEQGAMLATFTERVAEIDLLVSVGDTVSLGVQRYQPFVENPSFEGVRKADTATGADDVRAGESPGEAAAAHEDAAAGGEEAPESAVEADSADASTGAETG